MKLETLEILAAWFRHQTYGVNAFLEQVPRAATDDAPPEIKQVYSQYVDDWVGRDEQPPEIPSLTLVIARPLPLELTSGLPSDEVVIGRAVTVDVVFAARDALGAKALRHGSYTMRALKRSCYALTSEPGRDARRSRDVQLIEISRLEEFPIMKGLGRGSLTGLLTLTCQVADEDP